MKRIVFDARMYGLEHAGIGRYILSLLRKFEIRKFEMFLLVKKEKLEEVKQDLGDGFEYVPVKARHYSLFEQVEIPWVLRKLNPDLVHFPHFNAPILWRKNFVVTIHDLIKHYFTGKETTTRAVWLYRLKHLGYKIQINHALYNSKLIFVPSNFWKEKLSEDFDVPRKRVIVTPEAVEPIYQRKLSAKGRRASGPKLKQPYLIYTGSVYPHKNIEIVFKALKQLPNIQFGIACSRSVFTDRVERKANEMGLANQVKFLGFVSDKDLIPLYQKAIALVQPSLMEGFGLTGLEAMAAGCPVIAANASCLPEVYGQAGVYFDPYDSRDLLEKIEKVKNNDKLRQELISKGKTQVKKYSWQKTADLTLKGYERALKLSTSFFEDFRSPSLIF